MASLAQQALDLTAAVQTRVVNGGDPGSKSNVLDLATAIQLLAQNVMSATPSLDVPDAGATAVDVSPTIVASDPTSGQ